MDKTPRLICACLLALLLLALIYPALAPSTLAIIGAALRSLLDPSWPAVVLGLGVMASLVSLAWIHRGRGGGGGQA